MWPSVEVMKEVLSGHDEEDPKRERGREKVGLPFMLALTHHPVSLCGDGWGHRPSLSLSNNSLSICILIFISINSHLCIYSRERRVRKMGKSIKGKRKKVKKKRKEKERE